MSRTRFRVNPHSIVAWMPRCRVCARAYLKRILFVNFAKFLRTPFYRTPVKDSKSQILSGYYTCSSKSYWVYIITIHSAIICNIFPNLVENLTFCRYNPIFICICSCWINGGAYTPHFLNKIEMLTIFVKAQSYDWLNSG